MDSQGNPLQKYEHYNYKGHYNLQYLGLNKRKTKHMFLTTQLFKHILKYTPLQIQTIPRPVLVVDYEGTDIEYSDPEDTPPPRYQAWNAGKTTKKYKIKSKKTRKSKK